MQDDEAEAIASDLSMTVIDPGSVVTTAVSNFRESSKIHMKLLDGLIKIHPYVRGAKRRHYRIQMNLNAPMQLRCSLSRPHCCSRGVDGKTATRCSP